LEGLEVEVREAGGQAVIVGVHLAKQHHLVHLMEAASEAFGGLDALVFMARSCAPSLESFDVDSWERSVDVNVKGFLYGVAAALPIMREGGGGRVVYVGGEVPEAPDPLYRASRAATGVVLRELAREFSGEGVRAGEVYLEDLRRVSPERCAGAVRDLLVNTPDAGDDVTLVRVSGR
jgi:NAD(P)-dependent dehydrogenase (short-subunit alcohol dehydrogenase family)